MIQQIPHSRFDTAYYRWKYRLLLLFSPSWDDPDYLAQTGKFEALDEEFYARDLLLFTFMPSTPVAESLPGRRVVDSADHWRQFGLPPHTFAILLLDKDGAVQLRSSKPVDPELLFAIIDSMPVLEPDLDAEVLCTE